METIRFEASPRNYTVGAMKLINDPLHFFPRYMFLQGSVSLPFEAVRISRDPSGTAFAYMLKYDPALVPTHTLHASLSLT